MLVGLLLAMQVSVNVDVNRQGASGVDSLPIVADETDDGETRADDEDTTGPRAVDVIRKRLEEMHDNMEAGQAIDIPKTWTEQDNSGHRKPGPEAPTPDEAATAQPPDDPDLPEAV